MNFIKLFCLLICLVGCEPDPTSLVEQEPKPDNPNILPNYCVPFGRLNLPQGWEVVERIDSCTFYVKDINKNLCFVWTECHHRGHGPQALVPCEKLEIIHG